MFEIPAPVQGYQLPDGRFVATQEEYVEAVSESSAKELAGAYVLANAGKFERGQDTKAFNSIVPFLVWQAAQTYTGGLEGMIAAYRAKVAEEEANKGKHKKTLEAAQAAATETVTEVPAAPEAPPEQQAA